MRLLGVQRPVLAGVEHLELAERADRAGDQHVPAGDLARLAREADGGRVDRLELVLEQLRRQLAPVGAEGVGLDQLGAGADVARVHRDDALGGAQVRLLGAAQAADVAPASSAPMPPSATIGGPLRSRSRKSAIAPSLGRGANQAARSTPTG